MIEVAQVSPLLVAESSQGSGRNTPELAELQQSDAALAEVVECMWNGLLPADNRKQRQLVLEGPRFTIIEEVLYYVHSTRNDRPRVVVPESMRDHLMEKVHLGGLAGHFVTKGLYERLARRYWWCGMYGDVYRFCKGYLTCATCRGGGRRTRPLLMSIKVGGPFDWVEVDLMELPLTTQGNRYVVVFLDYLTKWVEALPLPDQTSELIACLLVDYIVC